MKFPLKSSIAAAALVIASMASTPASAAVACAGFMDNFDPNAIDCNGFYDGNVLSNNGGDVDIQEAAVEDLLGTDIDPFDFNDFPKIDNLGGATTLDLGGTFFGLTVIGIHFGAAQGQPDNVDNATGFFLFDFGAGGASSIDTSIPGSSALVLYGGDGTAVPEPSTWGMLLLGFGAAGFALRRRRKAFMAQVA